MSKSPIDELFNELFGYYPKKAGKAYELLVAAAIKAVTGNTINYDQHQKGTYSKTDYQIDAIVQEEKTMVEAKDYTIDVKKVGRGDLQKMQGALTDLEFTKGIFASATDYTKPARKYSDASVQNPFQKVIDLYHIRPSTQYDEKGRIKTFEIEMVVILPDYHAGQYQCAWTKKAISDFISEGICAVNSRLDTFYDSNGNQQMTLEELTYENQPISQSMEDEYGIGCWVTTGFHVKHEDKYYGLNGIVYKIPYTKESYTFTIEAEGKPKILIKSEDGSVNKLLTDKELQRIIFDNGEVK